MPLASALASPRLSHRHGSDVAIVSRKQEKLVVAAEQIVATTGRRCLPLVADVRQPESVEAAVNQVVQELGGLDIVVNNAAGNFFCPSAQLSPNGFGTVIDIDAKGTWNVSRAAYLARLKDKGGQILNISADLALWRHAGPGSRRSSQGGCRRDHPNLGRRVESARHPGQRHRPRPDRRYRGSPSPFSRRRGGHSSRRHPDPSAGLDR